MGASTEEVSPEAEAFMAEVTGKQTKPFRAICPIGLPSLSPESGFEEAKGGVSE